MQHDIISGPTPWTDREFGYDPDIVRFAAKSSLAARAPEVQFVSGGLPWIDPEDVLGGGFPALLLYDSPCSAGRIAMVRRDRTVEMVGF